MCDNEGRFIEQAMPQVFKVTSFLDSISSRVKAIVNRRMRSTDNKSGVHWTHIMFG